MADSFLQSLMGGYKLGSQIKQDRQQSKLAQLASQAYAAPQQDRSGILQQAVGVDPSAGFALGDKLQGVDDQRTKTLVQAARYLTAAPESARPAIYQQMKPTLSGFGMQLPEQYDQTVAETAQALVQAYAGNSGEELKSLRIGGNGNYWAIQGGRFVDTGIQADLRTQLRDQPGMAPGIVNLRTGEVSPLQGGAAGTSGTGTAPAPTRADMEADIGLANDMIAAGIPEAQVDAFLQSRGQRAESVQAAMPNGGGLAAARPSEAQTAAQVEAAKQAVQLQYLPQQQALETRGAIAKTLGTEQAKADVERQTGEPARQEKVRQALSKTANITRTIDDAMSRVGAMTAGFFGSMTDELPGTPANDLRVTVNTIKANLAFDALQAMREASPTGGALGAVSERELALLESAVASLDQSQSPEQLRQALARVKQHYGAWAQAVRQADQEARSRVGSSTPSASADGGSVDDLLGKYGIR